MIDFVRDQNASNDDLREQALDHLNKLHSSYIKWTPQQTLMVNVATPASAAEHWQEEIDLAMQLAPALAGSKALESKMQTIDDTAYIVFSGEGVVNVALAIRDELGKNFPGSASLPEGPKK